MKKNYLFTWPLAMLSLLLGMHMLFTMAPVFSEYQSAVNSAEAVKKDGIRTDGFVKVNYSYENYPNMGSKYGADVVYDTDKGKQIAWISMEKPAGITSPVTIIYNNDIPNFALDAKTFVLPHEMPNQTNKNIALALIIIPFLYVGFEFLRWFNSRSNEPQSRRTLTYPNPKQAINAGIMGIVFTLFTVLSSVTSFVDYQAAGKRIEAVREQGEVVFADLSSKCADRNGDECNNRYKALYSIEGKGNFNRLFQVKGEIISDESLRSRTQSFIEPTIPLLYNADDPRFAYALSSSEQVEAPYNVFKVLSTGALFAMCLVALLTGLQQRREK